MVESITSTSTQCYDLAIIGQGMIGSAAARHAAKNDNARIVLIGPSEPDPTTPTSWDKDDFTAEDLQIFGAHYDEGRITRRTDTDPIWAELASRSIARYGEILEESHGGNGGGIDAHTGTGCEGFYVECGHLAVGLAVSDMMMKRRQTAASMGVKCADLSEKQLRQEFPYLSFPQGCISLHEEKESGYISARRLVAAQTTAAERNGVDIIDAVANSVERCIDADGDRSFVINIAGEQQIKSSKVLVAAGAFCNARPLLPKKLELMPIKTQTVHFVLTEEDAGRLDDMPSIIVKNEDLWAYILPPIRYPDGTIRLKLGGAYFDSDGNEYGPSRQMHSDEEVVKWYQSNGSEEAKREMEKMLRSIVPNVEPTIILSNSCATLNTPTRQAYIGEVEDGWAVATGGNGFAAKSSDELGRLAATCVLHRISFEQENICGRLCTEVFCPRYSNA